MPLEPQQPTSLRWYVLKTKPRSEDLVLEVLARWGVECYAPRIVRPTGSRSTEYLFPGYVFVRLVHDSRLWPMVRWAPGVAYFVGPEREAVPVDDALIAHIRQRTEEWNNGGYRRALQPGEEVQVTEGPFAGLDAVFQRYLPARLRCQVLLRFLNRWVRVEIPASALRPRRKGFSLGNGAEEAQRR
ncbi:Transcription termination/antitermination protein NusG [bacterium HR23]|nr:Transcription termination/antitermination protein NusG [bacterium HR23]